MIEALVPTGVPGVKLAFTLLLWGSLTLGPAAALVLIYRYTAGRKPIPWIWTFPGTITAVLLWNVATLLFRLYVSQLAGYGTTYGSLSAVIVLLLWLMLSAYAVLLGAKVNTEAMRTANVCRPGAEPVPNVLPPQPRTG